MAEPTKRICPICGQEIEGEVHHCNPSRSNQKTVVAEGTIVQKTEIPEEDRSTRVAGTGAGKPTSVKLTKNIAATKVIKEVLHIEPDVDLDHASRIYFSKKQGRVEKGAGSSVTELISSSGEETKYIFDKEIGRGGMGVVLETVDQDIRRKVAMKVMLSAGIEDPDLIRRFLEEAQVTGQLEHPNIVPVHEIGIDEESKAYFTMKLVRGEDLDSLLAKIADNDPEYLKKYSLGSLIQIFMKVCDGISYAHSKGVLHRDLKPENIMVGNFGEVMVMDWGISKVLGREEIQATGRTSSLPDDHASFMTMEGQIMGTPSYMSPEQASGMISELDERSDIFQLGGILYSILTYQAPYEGKSPMDQLEKALHHDLIPPDLRAPDNHIPPELNAICMKAMARAKEDRYASASDLRNELQLYLDGKSVSAKKDNIIVRTKKWMIRNKVASIGIAAALICLIAGILFTALYEQKKKQDTIVHLLSQAQNATSAERYEEAEETFFSILGLDKENRQAREGISKVSGKALSSKNKRLALEKVKEAKALFNNKDYSKAYDAYVATFALDPESKEAVEGIRISAVMSEKQKAQMKIRPILDENRKLTAEKKEVDNLVSGLTEKVKKLKIGIKGHEDYSIKKPLWDSENTLQAREIDGLKMEGKIISNYNTILSYDGENTEAREALARIYYHKFTEAEALQKREEMAYYRELISAFDDGHYKDLLGKNGVLTLTTIPQADSYDIYRFLEGPDRRMIPAPFNPDALVAGNKNAGQDQIMQGIDPSFIPKVTAFVQIEKLLVHKEFNRRKGIQNLMLSKGSYLIHIKKKGYLDTRLPVLIKRGENTILKDLKLIKKKDVPEGYVYVPGGDFVMGGDSHAPYSPEQSTKSVPGFLISRNEVSVRDYLKFINDMEARLPGSAKKYLPRRAATSGFYWKKKDKLYQSNFPLDWPVLGISWNDARAYCKWMTLQNKDRGWEFRLPEDHEWEKAARGVDGRYFPWGNYFDYRYCAMAYSKKEKSNKPEKIGSFPMDESVYGVMDMSGNVAEWCNTFFDEERNIRINRGSAWSYVDENYARCAGKNGHSPSDVADFRGFRVAFSLKDG